MRFAENHYQQSDDYGEEQSAEPSSFGVEPSGLQASKRNSINNSQVSTKEQGLLV
jgi:hypothetical protein